MQTKLTSGDFTAHLKDGVYNIYRTTQDGKETYIGNMVSRGEFELFNTQAMDITDWICLHRLINECFKQFQN